MHAVDDKVRRGRTKAVSRPALGAAVLVLAACGARTTLELGGDDGGSSNGAGGSRDGSSSGGSGSETTIPAENVLGDESLGNESFFLQFGSEGRDEPTGIAVDRDGDIVVVGWTEGELAEPSAFVRMHDPGGQELWTRQFSTGGFGQANDVAVDPTGQVLVVGVEGSYPGKHAFVRKYAGGGNMSWTRSVGLSWLEEAHGVAVDSVGDVVVVGFYDPSDGPEDVSHSFRAFVRKYSASGNELWTRPIGPPYAAPVFANGVAVDGDRIFVAGYDLSGAFVIAFSADGREEWSHQLSASFGGRVAPDGARGVFFHGTVEGETVSGFLQRYAADGSEMWTRDLGSTAELRFHSIAADAARGVYAAGAIFTPPPGDHVDGDLGDVLLGDYDAQGDEIWTKRFGSPARDSALDLAVDEWGRICVVGITEGDLAARNAGETDVFVGVLAVPR